MTVEEYREKTSLKEQREFATKLQLWLGQYTSEAMRRALNQMDDILSNPFALQLIDELYERTMAERKEEIRDIMYDLGGAYAYDIHNHCTTHSNSYRDILYDMYIRQ